MGVGFPVTIKIIYPSPEQIFRSLPGTFTDGAIVPREIRNKATVSCCLASNNNTGLGGLFVMASFKPNYYINITTSAEGAGLTMGAFEAGKRLSKGI